MYFHGSTTTDVRPRAHQIDNFGPEVAAVTFTYNGVAHTINRRGKSNVKGFTSFVADTYTLTNGKDHFLRMSRSGFQFVSVLYNDGTIEGNGWIPLP